MPLPDSSRNDLPPSVTAVVAEVEEAAVDEEASALISCSVLV